MVETFFGEKWNSAVSKFKYVIIATFMAWVIVALVFAV